MAVYQPELKPLTVDQVLALQRKEAERQNKEAEVLLASGSPGAHHILLAPEMPALRDVPIWCGIDPGLDGALASIQGTEAAVEDIPTLRAGTPSKKTKTPRRVYDAQGMREMLFQKQVAARGRLTVVIEKQQPMPGQAAQAGWAQMYGYGLWMGLLAGLQIPVMVVTPQAWKKALMEGQPRTEEASVAAALRYYPTMRASLYGPKGGLKDGRADALLLARYGSLGLAGR
jgi:crossover junction endodeoxyribonuclease RuvC